MIHKINELDKAELKVQFRQMYKQIGFDGALQCLFEILLSGELLSEVILEERQKEERMEI